MDKQPIFVLGIQRGGTNQAINILRSHPAICWAEGEFHQIFRAAGLAGVRWFGPGRSVHSWWSYLPILLTAGDLLDPDRPPRRARLENWQRRALRTGFRRNVARNRAEIERHRHRLAEGGLADLRVPAERLLVKVMNYNLAFAEDLVRLYPDATFVGLIRDGRAVCEGHIARGASVEKATAVYNFVGRRLLELGGSGVRIRSWRFEDLLEDPLQVTGEIYRFCELDMAVMKGVCLQDKERVMDAAGRVVGNRRVERFYPFATMKTHMRSDVNAAALARLDPATRMQIEERCHDVLRSFGYLAAPAVGPAEAAG